MKKNIPVKYSCYIFCIFFLSTISLSCSFSKKNSNDKRLPIINKDLFRTSTAQEQESIFDEIQKGMKPFNALPKKETLNYTIKWIGLTVAKLTVTIVGIETINNRQAYKFELTAKTYKFFDKVFPIDDRMVSYMDIEKFHTLRQEVYRREGNYKKDAIVNFDQANHKAYFEHLLNGEKKTFDIPPNILDPLSAVYFFRMLPLEIDDEINYNVVIDEKIYDLFGRLEEKEFINVSKLGRVEALKMQPYGKVDNEEVQKMKVVGYFNTNDLKTPLKTIVRAPLFTSLTVTLDETKETLEQ